MKRGSIYWVNLEPTDPPEFGKVRPGMVLSNSEQNLKLPTVVIIPLSSQPPEIWPLRIKIEMSNGKNSYAVIPGVRQVSKQRLGDVIQIVAPKIVDEVSEALQVYLSD